MKYFHFLDNASPTRRVVQYLNQKLQLSIQFITMRRYQTVVISHSFPDNSEIEAFRHQFTQALGYCLKTVVRGIAKKL